MTMITATIPAPTTLAEGAMGIQVTSEGAKALYDYWASRAQGNGPTPTPLAVPSSLGEVAAAACAQIESGWQDEGRMAPKTWVDLKTAILRPQLVLGWKGTWTRDREVTVTLEAPFEGAGIQREDVPQVWNAVFRWKSGTGKVSSFLNIEALFERLAPHTIGAYLTT